MSHSDPDEPLPPLPDSPEGRRRPRKLVLIGAEEVHLHLLKGLRTQPLRGVDVTLIAPFSQAAWPELLPPVLAGRVPARNAQVDLAEVAKEAGIELIIDQVVGCDLETHTLELAVHDERTFDAVSININPANLRENLCQTHRTLVGLQPRATFRARLESRLAELIQQHRAAPGPDPLQFAVVGSSPAAVEFALCLAERIRREQWRADIRLIDASSELLPGWSAGAIRQVHHLCRQLGITVQLGSPVVDCDEDGPCELLLETGERLRVDLVIWATGTAPPNLLRNYPLPRSTEGWLDVEQTLRTKADLPFFAAGEIMGAEQGAITGDAAAQAKLLGDNLRRWFRREPLLPLQPIATGPKLLTCGDGTAILDHHGWSFRSLLFWRWKLRRILR